VAVVLVAENQEAVVLVVLVSFLLHTPPLPK
jgi:hypothetical protein